MKKKSVRSVIPVVALASVAALAGQQPPPQIQRETRTINIEVPVRVFKGDTFVDHLTIADFELYEDGERQALDAVYLVKKASIERQEGLLPGKPDTGRHFYLFFELTEYDPKVRDALEYFIQQVLASGDELVVVTPLKSYRMKSDILKQATRDKVLEKLLGLLRRDTLIGNADYQDILREMTSLATAVGASVGGVSGSTVEAVRQAAGDPFAAFDSMYEAQRSVEEQLQLYADCLSRLEHIRDLDAVQVNGLASFVRDQPGEKEILLFYQREYIPKIDASVMNALMSIYNQRPEVTQTLSGIFDFFHRDLSVEVEAVKRLYADSGAAIHFVYLTRPLPKVRGLTMEEQSEDIFSPFREMARATGGTISSTANMTAAMRSVVAASENYYLLYYTPKSYQADGKFRSLEVRVKGEGLRTTYRLGYIAD